MPTNRQITLAARPEGFPKETDFALVEAPVAEPGANEVLVRARWLSLDPYMRGRMSTARSYAKATEIGEVMTGQVVGEVVASEDPRLPPATRSSASSAGRTTPSRAAGRSARSTRGSRRHRRTSTCSARPASLPTSASSTWHGRSRATPSSSPVRPVRSGRSPASWRRSRAAARVGIAGGPEKVAELTELYGYDAGIDYKADELNGALKESCPNGVDVYFDNVGGAISETVFRRLNVGARIAICGQISQYNLVEPELAPRNLGFLIVFRARMEGFLVSDYVHRFGEALERLGRLLADGRLTYREDVTEGLEKAPAAFIGMLNGRNRGKALVKL